MRVLGVDPGTITVGFGILEETNGSYQAIDFGCLKLSSKELFHKRLKKIYDGLTEIIDQYKPDEFAIEDLFYAENVKVALKMGHARGVAILAAATGFSGGCQSVRPAASYPRAGGWTDTAEEWDWGEDWASLPPAG